MLALFALAAAAIAGSIVTPGEIVLGASLAFLLVMVVRSGYRIWLTDRRRVGRYLRPVLLVGAGAECAEIAALLTEHPELGYRTAGVVGDQRQAVRNGLESCWRGNLGEELEVLAERGIAGAIVCASDLHKSQLNQIVQKLLHTGIHVQLSSGLYDVDVGRLRPLQLAHQPLFYVEPVMLAPWQFVVKRAIDFALSALMLLVTAPVLGLAALGIKLQDGGPFLFKQSHVGHRGETFVLYKLRTIREGAERETANLSRSTSATDPSTRSPTIRE